MVEYACRREFRNLPECIKQAIREQELRKRLIREIEASMTKKVK
jgi:hypothetical protein